MSAAVATPRKVIDLHECLDVHDVIRLRKCSRAKAYRHIRAANARAPGKRGEARVSVPDWLAYLEFLKEQEAKERIAGSDDRSRMVRYLQVLLSSNEFMYLE